MSGSSDGVLRIFRRYESDDNVEIVTALRVLPDLIPSNKNAGLVFDWQQIQGKALVAGDVKVIRVWDAMSEICINVCCLNSFVLWHSKSIWGKSTNIAIGHLCSIGLLHNVVDI